MSAKQDLFIRLKYLESCLHLPAIIDNGITPSEHNGMANLLRKGLGIVAFNILEDYIKNRTIEALNYLPQTRVGFYNLTPELQEASTLGALTALLFRVKLEKKNGGDWKTTLQDESLKIHSTKNANYEISKYSFVSANSNINPDEISSILKAFGIDGGWAILKDVSDKIGGGIPDLIQSYRNASERRHSAAHLPSFKYDYCWLSGITNEILAISASLDILLSARCRQIFSDSTKPIKTHTLNNALRFRYLEPINNKHRETVTIAGRSSKNWADLNSAIATIRPRLMIKNEFLIILNSSKRVRDWYTD